MKTGRFGGQPERSVFFGVGTHRICLLHCKEILVNPRTPGEVANIRTELKNVLVIFEKKDAEGMKAYLTKIREKIK